MRNADATGAKTMTKITIRTQRPNGEIETTDVSDKFSSMNDGLFGQIKEATLQTGRGICLDYTVERTDTRTDAEKEWGEVDRLFALAEQVQDRPADYLRRERTAKVAKAEWATKYPEAHKAMALADDHDEAKRLDSASVVDPYTN